MQPSHRHKLQQPKINCRTKRRDQKHEDRKDIGVSTGLFPALSVKKYLCNGILHAKICGLWCNKESSNGSCRVVVNSAQTWHGVVQPLNVFLKPLSVPRHVHGIPPPSDRLPALATTCEPCNSVILETSYQARFFCPSLRNRHFCPHRIHKCHHQRW